MTVLGQGGEPSTTTSTTSTTTTTSPSQVILVPPDSGQFLDTASQVPSVESVLLVLLVGLSAIRLGVSLVKR